MLKPRNHASRLTSPCRAASSLSILLIGLCALLFSASAIQAQTHSN